MKHNVGIPAVSSLTALYLAGLILVISPNRLLAQVTEHPRPELRNRPSGANVVEVHKRVHVALDGGERQTYRQLLNARHIATIGTADGSAQDVFGEIVGVDIDDEGRVYVLDGRFAQVSVFDRRGRYVQHVGRTGEGPGEYLEPRAMTLGPTNWLAVSDSTRRLTLLAVSPSGGGPALAFETRLDVDLGVLGLCAFPDHFLVLGMKYANVDDFRDPANAEARILHLLDAHGQLVRSFGRSYNSPNPLIVFQVTSGPVACDAGLSRVYHAPSQILGEVRAYDIDGTARWIAVLKDFQPIKLAEKRAGSTFSTGRRNYDEVEAVHLVGDEHLLVQTVTKDIDKFGVVVVGVDSYLLSRQTGTGVYVGDVLPIVAAVNGSFFVTLSTDPFPQLALYEITPDEGASSR